MNSLPQLFAALRVSVALCLAATSLVGCTSMHQVPRSDFAQIAAKLKPGDHVRCTLHTGEEIAFMIVQVDSAMLVGKRHRVALTDIARLEVKKFSAGKTVWLLIGIAAAGLMAEGMSHMGGLVAASGP